ncbi:MAG: hypothetical protein QOH81_803 [Sphingomonadales bacterium]|jgi:hypothetical protein|nr:hypothetical protein [Sphingomonadales bacterium]
MNEFKVSRRSALLGGSLSLLGAAAPVGRAAIIPEGSLTPEMFGARGDGVTNDSAAFAALSAAITRRGGGVIALRRKVYVVGAQRHDPTGSNGYAFAPESLLRFVGLPGPLTILGNGATLRCQSGLRYGTFVPATGAPSRHAMPYLNPRERATPYEYMIYAERCVGAVTISDLELDGNLPRLVIGGEYGDTGRQIAGSGIFLRDNRGDEILRSVSSHHHPQDGIIIDGNDDPVLAARVTRRAEDIRCEYNARQGCSIVGGRNWSFSRCKFNHTGKAVIQSAPGAGVDIEAEGSKKNRNLSFEDCEFADNTGCGLVADSGDSEGATFTRCRFVGTTMWSVWPNKPLFSFRTCTFIGSAVKCFSDADPIRTTKFYDCLFTDDPKLSPNGKVYREGRADGSLADLSDGTNVRFERCRFLAVGGAVLPWSSSAIYANCRMVQTSPSVGYPHGTYIGHNVISGRVDLYGIKIKGDLILNGKPFRP